MNIRGSLISFVAAAGTLAAAVTTATKSEAGCFGCSGGDALVGAVFEGFLGYSQYSGYNDGLAYYSGYAPAYYTIYPPAHSAIRYRYYGPGYYAPRRYVRYAPSYYRGDYARWRLHAHADRNYRW
jgi:hypothetical protein